MDRNSAFGALQRRITACKRCPELREYTARVAREKRRAYIDWTYWGKPVPAFGDCDARVALVGLAPAAHGANRTGRMFTGDSSGEWLYRALFRAGFANQAHQSDRDDGLQLRDAVITAALRCAPPFNKPTPEQLVKCAPYLDEELRLLDRLEVVIGLGAIGTRAAKLALENAGFRFRKTVKFGHLAEAVAEHEKSGRRLTLLSSYHPSRQNTNTGKLTQPMLDAVFQRARTLVDMA